MANTTKKSGARAKKILKGEMPYIKSKKGESQYLEKQAIRKRAAAYGSSGYPKSVKEAGGAAYVKTKKRSK